MRDTEMRGFRAKPGVVIGGVTVEDREGGNVGPARVFLSAENLLDVRRTTYDPFTLPARAPDGRRTTDVWVPSRWPGHERRDPL
jgi:hypothetical protein